MNPETPIPPVNNQDFTGPQPGSVPQPPQPFQQPQPFQVPQPPQPPQPFQQPQPTAQPQPFPQQTPYNQGQPINPPQAQQYGPQQSPVYADPNNPAIQPPVFQSPILSSFDSTQPLPKKSHRKLITIIVACGVGFIILLIVGAIALYSGISSATKEPLAVSNSYIADLTAGNYSAAANLESPAFKQVASQTKVAIIWNGLNINRENYTVINKSIAKTPGQPETVIIIYKYNGSNPYYVKIELQKNNTWQVLNFAGSPNQPSDSLN